MLRKAFSRFKKQKNNEVNPADSPSAKFASPSGEVAKMLSSSLTIPFPMVSMTWCPCSKPPSIANMATRIAARLKGSNPQPTVVPMQLAVSLAPIFQPT